VKVREAIFEKHLTPLSVKLSRSVAVDDEAANAQDWGAIVRSTFVKIGFHHRDEIPSARQEYFQETGKIAHATPPSSGRRA
jgi:hypothetical protein